MAALRAAELEVLFTANTTDVERGEKDVKTAGERIEKKPVKQKVTADSKDALAGMDRVEQAAKKLVSQDTALKLDADIGRAEKSLDRAKQRLADLEVRALGGLDVTADVRRAEANLQKIERNLAGLQSARTQIDIDANTVKAEQELEQLQSKAEDAGSRAGDSGGRSFVSGLDGATRGAGQKVGDVVGGEIEDTLVSALAAIPVAGGILLAGVAIGKAVTGAIQDGLAQEVGYDRLEALTGISPADALRLGRAAGEAYANVFGESVEANMDTARLALQFNIIDESTSTRSAQKVVEGLAGIADVLGEDVRPVAQSVTTLLSTGMARSAEHAFDLLATGAREGVNRNEDLLDTLTEYPALFQRLGLSGEEALGLINQGMQAGARNSDLAADALKEFQIRASEDLPNATLGFELLGMGVEDSMNRVAAGGQTARDTLAETLARLNEMEPGVDRTRAAMALFGTQAEDLGDSLFAMDLSTAVAQLDGVTGSAQRMFDTLADNDATKISQAQRNIEVAADGIKGALASAFSEPLGNFADWVSQNRGPLLQFMSDLANGGIDFGVSMVEGLASGTEAAGEFIAGPLADLTKGLAGFVGFFDKEAGEGLDALVEDMRGFDETTAQAADTMRTKLIDQGLEVARGKMNGFLDGAIAIGYVNDASLRLAGALEQVGLDGEGALLALDGIDLANLRASDSGKLLEDQIRNASAALADEVLAAEAAGEGQTELAERYRLGTEALVGQLMQMGLTREQAQALIDTVKQTPTSATTAFSSNADEQRGKVQALADRVTTMPDGTVIIHAQTEMAYSKLMDLQALLRSVTGDKSLHISTGPGGQGGLTLADGALVEFMAAGGVRGRGLTPMSRIAQVVPPNTWRVVGDRMDVPEIFAPLDGSARSWSILMEGLRRMPGVMPMADGAIVGASVERGPADIKIYVTAAPGEDPRVTARAIGRELKEQLGGG